MSALRSLRRATRRIQSAFPANSFRVSTWLAIGGIVQLLILSCLPRTFAILLPALLLVQRMIQATIDSRNVYKSSFKDVHLQRMTTNAFPEKMGNEDEGVVMFVLGARINHPQGAIAANAAEMGKLYAGMWKEAEKNRSKWGYLGRTPMLTSSADQEGFTLIWNTYWRSTKGLWEFAKCAAHRAGQKAYLKDDKFPYIGIMHELYFAKKDATETLYDKFPPFGLGSAKIPIKKGDGTILVDALVPDKEGGSGMYERMAWNSS